MLGMAKTLILKKNQSIMVIKIQHVKHTLIKKKKSMKAAEELAIRGGG